MKIWLIEPYFSGSHKKWATDYQKKSSHEVKIFSLKGRNWKWRMHGGAITLAKQVLSEQDSPDLILATSMLDLTTFTSLTRKKLGSVPIVYYFHENQWSYPLSHHDKDIQFQRDQHYGFIQLASALSADRVFFNSQYHLDNFLLESKKFLKSMRDCKELDSLFDLQKKCSPLPLGMDLGPFDSFKKKPQNKRPLILWNHRWEYDKNPKAFFDILKKIDKEKIPFDLALLGQCSGEIPLEFKEAKNYFKERVLAYGHQDSFEDYASWLWKSDIAFNTSHHDFFGMSAVESLYCECYPIFPDRLAYPEHFEGPVSLYQNDEEAYLQLKKVLLSYPKLEGIPTNKSKNYDWKKMSRLYDKTFENL